MNHQESFAPLFDVARTGSRRDFLHRALAAGASVPALAALGAIAAEPEQTKPELPKISRRFKAGVVGLGHRGNWVSRYMKAHGGFEIHCACDYFPDDLDKFGDLHGIDKSRRFSGLSGYKKLVDSDVDIVVITNMPRFHPEQAAAAVAAGKHVYLAKPVAVDVPGVFAFGEAAKAATAKGLAFMVDYQAPTEPANIEIRKRILAGALGKLAYICTYGLAKRWHEPKPGDPTEERLRHTMWLHDVALAADACVSYDIHSIDVGIWILGKRPVAALGNSARVRPDAFLDGRDVVHATMEMDDGLVWTHMHQSLQNEQHLIPSLCTKVFGTSANATLPYSGTGFILGSDSDMSVEFNNTYEAGVQRNVARFYTDLVEGRSENPTIQRAIDGHLTAILIREAAYRHKRLTMEELLAENKKLDFDLTGFRVS